jgi:hypothetical protein
MIFCVNIVATTLNRDAMFLGGFLLFLFIFLMAFWILLFLSAFALPYAVTQWLLHKLNPTPSDEDTES